MTRLFLGIDAGASKTVCLVGDVHAILGRGLAGSANPNVVGLEGHTRAVREAAAAAFADAGWSARPVSRVWLGVAGSERPETRNRIQAAAAAALASEDVRVSHDARLILPAAGLSVGVGLVAGTGSSAFGSGPDGSEVAVGGWGYLFGDEGSGYELGRLALRAVSQAADGRGEATVLTDRILRALGLVDPLDLLTLLYPAPPASEIAALAPTVIDAASDGDPVANRIVAAGALALADLVRVSARAVGLGGPDGSGAARPVDVVVAGGIARVGSPVLSALVAGLGALAFHVRPLEAEPAFGALELARRPPVSASRPGQSRR